MVDYTNARNNMVDGQIRPNNVYNSQLIKVLREVPREYFVPRSTRAMACTDEDLPIGNGRYLIEPLIFSRLVEEADIRSDDIVLDIGYATGYSTVILAHLSTTVLAIDNHPDFVERATTLIAELEIENALVYHTDITKGYPEQAPYDIILIQGTVSDVPSQEILNQLADNGRLVTVLKKSNESMGKAHLFKRIGSTISNRVLFDANTPYLPGFEPKPCFNF